MYEASSSTQLLDEEQSASFTVKQGIHTCSLSTIQYFLEVEKAGLGIQLGEGGRIGGVLFADDIVGVSDSKEQLQKLIDVV